MLLNIFKSTIKTVLIFLMLQNTEMKNLKLTAKLSLWEKAQKFKSWELFEKNLGAFVEKVLKGV